MTERRKKIIILVLASLAALVFYILLHESGHCIVALACGARITEFSVITAHMRSEGGNFTFFTEMLLNCGGALLPYTVGVIWLALDGRRPAGGIYRSFSFAYLVSSMYSVIPWILIPVTFARGYAPEGDDVTRFLITFTRNGRNPMIVSAAALLLLVFNLSLMIRKGTLDHFVDYMRDMGE